MTWPRTIVKMTKPKRSKLCVKPQDLSAQFCHLKNMSLTSILRVLIFSRDPRKVYKTMTQFGMTILSLVNVCLVIRWKTCQPKQSCPLLTQTAQSGNDNRNAWQEWLWSLSYYSMAVSGHRSNCSIRSSAPTSWNIKRKMSKTLSSELINKKWTVILLITNGTISSLKQVDHEIVPANPTNSLTCAVELLLTNSQEQYSLKDLNNQQSLQKVSFHKCTFNFSAWAVKKWL